MCRPVYHVPAASADTPSLPVNATTPSFPPSPAMSIATSNIAAGRIQKHARKPSNFQSPADNVIRALDSELLRSEFNNGIRIPVPTSDLAHSTNKLPASGRTVEQTPTPAMSQIKTEGLVTKSITESKPSGCCAAKAAIVTPPPQQRSCCGGSSMPKDAKPAFGINSEAQLNSVWTESYHQSENVPEKALSWSTPLPKSNYTPQDSTFTAGTHMASPYIQSQSHQTALSQTLHTLNAGYQDNSVVQALDPFYLNSSTYPYDMQLPFVHESSHDCSCGESCQCLGCASHPFNATTRQHVQEMGYMMTVKEDDEKSSTTTPFAGARSPPDLNSTTTSNQIHPEAPNLGLSYTDDTALHSSFDNNLSSPTFATSQFMQPSEYYTLEYSVGLSLCSNTTGTCQCGNDCSCVGCLTHSGHDGVVLESVPNESQPVANMTAPQQYHDYHKQDNDVPRSMDQYPPAALSSPVVQTSLV